MGFSSAYIKFYFDFKSKGQKKDIKKLNGMYLLLFISMGVIALIIGGALVNNINGIFSESLSTREINLTRFLMIIMIINIALTFPSSVFDSNILVNEKFVFQQVRQMLQTFLVPVISIPMILLGAGVLSIGITQTAITLIFLILNMRYCTKKLNMKFEFKELPFNLLKQLSAFSFFIFLNQVVDLVNNNMPNFILGIMMGAKSVATFAISIQIKNMFFMLSTSLSGIFVPQVNEIVSSEKEDTSNILTNLMTRVGRIQMTILLFILGGFIVIGQYFISIWVGSENIDAYMLVILMVMPSIIPLSQNIGIEIQRAMNKHIFRSIVYSLFAVINILITVLGINYFGIIGATIGYIVSIVLANGLLMNWYYHNKIGLKMGSYWKNTISVTYPFILVTSLLMFIQKYIVINSIKSFVIFGFIYVLLYGIVYILFSANNYEKKVFLGKMFNKFK
jgi:O-antigen/teichoic acid export membrane protein